MSVDPELISATPHATREVRLSQEPSFLVFVPLLCAVWADGMVDEVELAAIRRALDDADWMTQEGQARVREWLDRKSPPPTAVYAAATAAIQATAGDGVVTLTRAGLALVEASTPPDVRTGPPPWCAEAAASLGWLETEMGLSGGEALRDLVSVQGRAAVTVTRAPGLADQLARAIRGDYPELRAQVRAALIRPELRIPHSLPLAEQRERTLTAVKALADAGLGAFAFPEEYGGAGDAGAGVAVFEELALGDLSVLVKYGVHFGLFGGSIAQLGTEKHHRRYLARVASMELPGCYAMTETGHGSNVRQIRTVATYDAAAREFVVTTPDDDARKDYIGNAALHGRMATVFARLVAGGTDHGVHAFLVPIRNRSGETAPGVSIEDCGAKAGLNGVDNGRIRFDAARVPEDALLDRFAGIDDAGEYESSIPSSGRRFFTMLGTLVSGRVSIAAASTAVSRKALTIAVRYTASRRQFGPAGGDEVPVLTYLSVQRALLPRLARCYATGFAVRALIRRLADPSADRRRVEVQAAALKATASRDAMDVLQACREACGGQGYLAENQFGRLIADTDVFTTFEGANPVLQQLVAKSLLSRYGRDMGDLSMWGMARYLAELTGTRLAEMNPVATRRTDPEHLAGHDFHLAALRYREERLLRSAARRLKAKIDAGVDSFDAANECQDHLIALASAHADRVLLIAALDGLEATTDSEAKTLLARVLSLFGLSTLERHRAWYMEAGYLEPVKSKAVRAEVNRACRELAPHAVELVDAFQLSDDLIGAPIGAADRSEGMTPSSPVRPPCGPRAAARRLRYSREARPSDASSRK